MLDGTSREQSIALAFLDAGAVAYVGNTRAASNPIFAYFGAFWDGVAHHGLTIGQAHRRGQNFKLLETLETDNPDTAYDQIATYEINLLGDPALSPHLPVRTPLTTPAGAVLTGNRVEYRGPSEWWQDTITTGSADTWQMWSGPGLFFTNFTDDVWFYSEVPISAEVTAVTQTTVLEPSLGWTGDWFLDKGFGESDHLLWRLKPLLYDPSSGSVEAEAVEIFYKINFEVPPTDVIIAGPTAGVVQEAYVFTATVSPATTTLPITYVWKATGQSPVMHTGGLSDAATLTWATSGVQFITVTVMNAAGTIIGTHATSIHIPVQAGFVAFPTSGCAPMTVAFTNTSSGDYTTSLWGFGDGVTSTQENPVHTYTTAGVYTVILTVDGPGGDDTLTRTSFITVTTAVIQLDPAAASARVGIPTTLTAAISHVENLGSFQFTLIYDPALVQVDGVTLGDFVDSTGRTFFQVGPVISNTVGTAVFGAFSLGSTPPGPSGGGSLAHVRLLPRTGGVATLYLYDVQASNVAGQSIPVLTQDATLSISACIGDFDGDGDIDILDVQRVAFRWNTHCGDVLYDPVYDQDGDCDIDILDVQQVAYRWGTRCIESETDSMINRLSSPQQDASLVVLPPNRTVQVGQTFTVGVAVSDVVDLGAFEFILGYSPTVVEVTLVVLGEFPKSTGRDFVPTGPVISSTAGIVSFGAYSMGATPEGPSGDGMLAVLTLRALTEGVSDLDFISVQVGDRAGNPLAIDDLSDGQVVVESTAVSIRKTVSPTGQVDYGGELTYTLVISAASGAQFGLYDPLDGTTFLRFVERPAGVAHSNGVITGQLTVTPTSQVTVSFVTQVGIPSTVGWTVTVTNKACVYPVDGTLDHCTWSNEVMNPVFRPHMIYLPLVMRSS